MSARRPRPAVLAIVAAACAAATAQDPALDYRPLPDDRNPVAIAVSPFHVWIATSRSLARWSRIGDEPPLWYGPGRDLPTDGIVAACWDDRSARLRLMGADGSSYEWSESAERAQSSSAGMSCESDIYRIVPSSELPNLIPEAPGWMYQAGGLREPGGGRRAAVRLAVVVENRELWLATNTAGVWKGRWPSGRISPLSSGLGETCIERAVAASDGSVWMLGCGGSVARKSEEGLMQSIDPRSPRWTDLHHAIDLAPARGGSVWFAVPSGVVLVDRGGVLERRLGRKAPFGGEPVALASLADTVWCLAEHGLSASVRGGAFVAIPLEDSGSTFRVLCIAPTRRGLLAGTPNGFRLWNGDRWIRPASLTHALSRPVRRVAVEPGRDRIAWSDGTLVRVDTLSAGAGSIGAWTPPSGTLRDFAWDGDGRLHLAHVAWTIWRPDDGRMRTWTVPGVSVELVAPGSAWTFLGGTTGGIEARTSAWAP